MLSLRQLWRNHKGKLLVALVGSFPLGVAASYTANWIGRDIPRLSIDYHSSSRAGLTVTDVVIENTGDYDLQGLTAQIVFEHAPTYSIEPDKFRSFSSVKDSIFHLELPKEQVFSRKQPISIRFVSDNPIKNISTLPTDIHSDLLISKHVQSVWKNKGFVGDIGWTGLFVGVLFIVVVVAIITLTILVAKLQRKVAQNQGPVPREASLS